MKTQDKDKDDSSIEIPLTHYIQRILYMETLHSTAQDTAQHREERYRRTHPQKDRTHPRDKRGGEPIHDEPDTAMKMLLTDWLRDP